MSDIISMGETGTHAPGLHGNAIVRNAGHALELDWINEIQINRSAVERRCATLGGRRSVRICWKRWALPTAG